jgi:hypothetical protein
MNAPANLDLFESAAELKFRQWREANPAIVGAFCDIADDFRRRTKRVRWSAWAVIQILRWQTALRDQTQEDFKIANGCIADLARMYNKAIGFEFFATRVRKDGRP